MLAGRAALAAGEYETARRRFAEVIAADRTYADGWALSVWLFRTWVGIPKPSPPSTRRSRWNPTTWDSATWNADYRGAAKSLR